jgi:hypothetical protein
MNDGDAAGVQPMLWALARSLRSVADDVGFDDLRDALWLAQHLPRQVLSHRLRGGTTQATSEPVGSDAAAADRSASPPEAGAAPAPTVLGDGSTRPVTLHDDVDQAESGLFAGANGASMPPGGGARRVRLPAPHPLPDALALGRALQPITRRRPRGPAVLLDEEATAEAIAHTGLKVPVLRPRRERWFELVLAVDNAPSMRAWHLRIDEFEALLRRTGFRDVRRVALDSVGACPLIRTSGGTPLTAQPRAASSTIGGAESLLLVVSDASAATWHDGRVSTLLVEWAQLQPVALLQALPSSLWPHTAVGFAELKVHGITPGEPTAKLAQQRPGWALGEQGMVVPVLAFEANEVARWARMVMAAGSAWCPAALLPAADDAPASTALPTAMGLLVSFRAAATAEALELAAAFATIRPLNLPVMRLIQAVMVPGAGQEALAQVLMSGLLTDSQQAARASAMPDLLDDEATLWEIDDAVRDELARHLTRSRWLHVNLAVQRFLEVETGVGFDFLAFIEDRLGLEQIAPSALPFARLAARMAKRFVRGSFASSAPRIALERVLAPGVTVQAETSVSTEVRRLLWSPSGETLAVLHSVGVDRLSARVLGTKGRERIGEYQSLWATQPNQLQLIPQLAEAVCYAAERFWKRPWGWGYATTIKDLVEPRPMVMQRVVARTGNWSEAELHALTNRRYQGLAIQVVELGRPSELPMVRLMPVSRTELESPAGREFVKALATTVKSLRHPRTGAQVEYHDGSGTLDRPVRSQETQALAQKLAESVVEVAHLKSEARTGRIDAMGWSTTAGDEQLRVVGRERRGAKTTTVVYQEGELVLEVNNRVVAEYSAATGLMLASKSDRAIVINERGEVLLTKTGPLRGARFSPDGSRLASIDSKGFLQLDHF